MANSNDANIARPREPRSRPINNLRFEIITNVGQLSSLRAHWDSLCDRSIDYNFSQSFQWCAASWNIMHYPQRRRLYCLVGWMNNRMVLIWPFVILRRGLWSMLRPLGSETSVYSDVLVEDSPEADHWVALAWQKLRTTCNSDIIALPFVRTNSRLHRIISQERPEFAWVNSISSISWYGYQSWESYHQSLNRNFRYSLRSRRRRATEHGNLSFEVVTKHEQFRPILNWLFFHKTEWLIRTKQRLSQDFTSNSPWYSSKLAKNRQ